MKLQIKYKIHYLILILLFFTVIFSIYFLSKPIREQAKQAAQTNVIGKYTIGIYQEKIAVFTQGDSLPIEVYDVYVSTLPIFDQKELEKGVKVNGAAELRRRIEDYTS